MSLKKILHKIHKAIIRSVADKRRLNCYYGIAMSNSVDDVCGYCKNAACIYKKYLKMSEKEA